MTDINCKKKKLIKIIKCNILGFVLGLIVMSGISVMAVSYLYKSDDVIYKKYDNTEVKVNSALNELYDMVLNSDSNHIVTLAKNVNGSSNIDIKSLYPEEYTKFTTDNFVIKYSGVTVTVSSGVDPAENKSASASGNYSMSYNSTTGVLSISVPTVTAIIYGNTNLPASGSVYVDILLIN